MEFRNHSLSALDLRHLRYFRQVAEELSYSRAAQRLNIAQPALSRAVQELEAALEVQLLARNRRSVRLTPTGEVLLHEAALLLDGWEEALQRVHRSAVGEEGELRLAYVGPPTQAFLGRLLAHYRQRYPRVSLHLEEHFPEQVWDLVRQGRVTAGLTHPVGARRGPELAALTLRRERMGAAVAPHHPWASLKSISWLALEREPLILLARRESAGTYEAVLSGCQKGGFIPRIAHTPSLVSTVLSYAEAGEGVAIIPESVVTPSSGLRFIALKPVQIVPLALVWRAGEATPPLERFRELLAEWQAEGKL